MARPRVGIILLNWNQEEDTVECLSSLSSIDYPHHEIVLVDNGSTDGSPDRIKNKFPGVTLLKNKANLGFAEGNNVGIRHLQKTGADYFLLLNNDTVVSDNFLSRLIDEAERRPECGILGPKIVYYDSPGVIWYAGGGVSRLTGRTYHFGLRKPDSSAYDSVRRVDFVTGCAMLIKRRVVDEIGGLDPDFFNSHEDVDFCLRARGRGFTMLYVPSSVIRHKYARAMGGGFSPFYIYYRVRNGLLLAKKNRFPVWMRSYAGAIYPLKMLLFTLFTLNLGGARSVLLGIRDFLLGRVGMGGGK